MMLIDASRAGSLERGADARLRREVEDDLRPMSLEQRHEPVGAHVHVEERELLAVAPRLREVRDVSRGEVVDRDHAVSLGEQSVGEVRADEPGAPGHQDGASRAQP